MSDPTHERPLVDASPAEPIDDSFTPREERARQSGYRRRFGVIYIVLALIAGLGLGALVVLVANPDDTPKQVWSRW